MPSFIPNCYSILFIFGAHSLGYGMSAEPRSNFLRTQIQADLEAARVDDLVTRFPPEPNGYLHIGHAKSITVNFGLAEQFGGRVDCLDTFDMLGPDSVEHSVCEAVCICNL